MLSDQRPKNYAQQHPPAHEGSAQCPAPPMLDAAKGSIGARALQHKLMQRKKGRRSLPGDQAAPAEAAPQPRIVGHTQNWYVFDQELIRPEVIAFFWGTSFTPNLAELYGKDEGDDIMLPTRYWALPKTGVASRREMWTLMRPEAAAQVDAAKPMAMQTPLEKPDWVPEPVWTDFLHSQERMKKYPGASPTGTNVVMVRASRSILCYTEAIEDKAMLAEQLHAEAPGQRRSILGEETVSDARIRWLAQTNQHYNLYVWRAVESGMTLQEARGSYRNAVHQAYLAAFAQAIGFLGTGVSFSSQATTLIETGREVRDHR